MPAMQFGIFRSAVFFLAVAAASSAKQPVTITATDGVRVYGDFYPAENASHNYILLFHQAGSNRAEYETIAPRLAKLGFNCLAIDQRSGGDMWNQKNETAMHAGGSDDYIPALHDLEAAFAWAKPRAAEGRILVWGSSYSASLVFLLAAEHPKEISAVLAFSPGEYLDNKSAVHKAAGRVMVPIFVTSAKDHDEIAAARSILAASPSARKTQFVPRVAGVHGSSTLRDDRNRAGAAENWVAVETFLRAQ